ncbi:MAG: biotin/lipoyl-containing protein [Pseudomonadota bacterium]
MSERNDASDVAFIEALAQMLRANDLTEIEVRREYGEDIALDVRVARQIAAAPAPGPILSAPPAQVAHDPVPEVVSDPALDPGAVTSPMVGTAYLQPEPGASPFVQVGDSVSEGQTLLIIEAMKTMNHIPAPRAGVVKRILVEDGAPVEFGAPLFVVS